MSSGAGKQAEAGCSGSEMVVCVSEAKVSTAPGSSSQPQRPPGGEASGVCDAEASTASKTAVNRIGEGSSPGPVATPARTSRSSSRLKISRRPSPSTTREGRPSSPRSRARERVSFFRSQLAKRAAADRHVNAFMGVAGGAGCGSGTREEKPHSYSKLVRHYGDTVICVAFSSDERLFAVAGQLGHVVLFDVATGEELHTHKLPKKVGITSLLLSGPSTHLRVMFGTFKGEFHAFEWGSGRGGHGRPSCDSHKEEPPMPRRSRTSRSGSPRPRSPKPRPSRVRAPGATPERRAFSPWPTDGAGTEPTEEDPLARSCSIPVASVPMLSLEDERLTPPFPWHLLLPDCSLESMAMSEKYSLVVLGGASEHLSFYYVYPPSAAHEQLTFGRSRRSLTHDGKVSSISIGADGELLAVGGDTTTLNLFEVASGRMLRKLLISSPSISVALSQDGTKLAVGSATSTKLFQVRWQGRGSSVRPSTEKLLDFPQGTPQGQVAFSADGSNLAMAGEIGIERSVTIISTSTGATMRQQRFDERVRCVALDSTGSRLLLGTFGKVAELYFQGSGTTMKHFGPSPDTVRCVYMHKRSGLLAVSGDTPGGGTVYVYDTNKAAQNGNTPIFKLARAQKVWSVTISPDSRWLTAGGYDMCIAVFDLQKLLQAATSGGDVSGLAPVQILDYKIPDFRGPCFVWSSAFSGNGKVFISGSWNGFAYMYDVAAGTQIGGPLTERMKIRFTRGERVYAVATSFEGERMVIGGRDGNVVMYKCQDEADGPRKLWVAGGRDFVYTVSMTHQYCAFAGTSRLVQVVSATTGDLLYKFSVFGNVQSLFIHKSYVAVGVQEESTVAVHDISKLREILCLPSVHGAVHHVHLDDDSLIFAGGKQASMYGGGGDFSWSQVPDYYVAAALIHGELQMSLRCLSSILSRNPEVVNCRHPRRAGTFLQYATQTNADIKVLRLLLEGNDQTKIGLLYDIRGETALHTALRLGNGDAIELLISSIIKGRVMNLPSALEPVVECFPQLAHEHPREFLRLLRDHKLIVQREAVWPRFERPLSRIQTMGSDEARLREPWQVEPSFVLRFGLAVQYPFKLCMSRLRRYLAYRRGRNAGRHQFVRRSPKGSMTNEQTLAEDAENGCLRQTDTGQNTMFALLTKGAEVEAGKSKTNTWRTFKMKPPTRRKNKLDVEVNIESPSVPQQQLTASELSLRETPTPRRQFSRSRVHTFTSISSPTRAAPSSAALGGLGSPQIEDPVEMSASVARMAELMNTNRLAEGSCNDANSPSRLSRTSAYTDGNAFGRDTCSREGFFRSPPSMMMAERSGKGLAESTIRSRLTTRSSMPVAAPHRNRAQVKVFTVPWRGWAARRSEHADHKNALLNLIIIAVNATDDLTIFQADAVRALLDFKWRAFARTVFTSLLLVYLIGLIATIIQAERLLQVLVMRFGWASGAAEPDSLEPIWLGDRFDPSKADCYTDWDTTAAVWRGLTNCQSSIQWTYVLTFVRSIFFLILEFVEMNNEGLRSYFLEYWNYLDFMNSILPLVVDVMLLFPQTWKNEQTGRALADIMAITCLVAGVKLFWHVRVIGNVGPLVAMVVEIMVTNVFPFLLLMVISVFAFSFALYILLGPTDVFFATPVSAFFMSWGMAVYVRGDHTHMSFVKKRFINPQHQYEAEGPESDFTLALVVYEMLMLMVQVVLLNLLIAIMSDTYTRARESILLKARYDKAQIIWEYELLTCWALRNIDRMRARRLRFRGWFQHRDPDEEPPLESSGKKLFPDWLHIVSPNAPLNRQGENFDAAETVTEGLADENEKGGTEAQRAREQLMHLEITQNRHHQATSNMLLNLKSALLQVCDNLGIEQARLGEHLTPTVTPPLLQMQHDLRRLSTSLRDLDGRISGRGLGNLGTSGSFRVPPTLSPLPSSIVKESMEAAILRHSHPTDASSKSTPKAAYRKAKSNIT